MRLSRQLKPRYEPPGAQVVGVSTDTPQSHEKFTAKYELNFPLLADPDKRMVKAYGVYKKKSLYGREFMGIERTTFGDRSSGRDSQGLSQGQGQRPRGRGDRRTQELLA